MDYRNKIILAPMVRVCTLPMRLLALEYGAELVYTEELIDWKLMKCERKENQVLGTVDYIETEGTGDVVFRTCDKEKGKVILQIGTASAERAVKAAKLVENDVAGIDVNMGCPKEFSVKGGMGVALAANVENAKSILSALVKAVKLPVTCKIRIKKTAEETIDLVRELESCGIKAIAIHGRTKNERPQHQPHPDIIKTVAAAVKLPVICNGGSREIQRFQDILKFKKECAASSIMIARAAEWNASIFRANGILPVMDVIKRYLTLAIDYGNHSSNTKYCVQNMLREHQESEMGKKFLEAQTMEQICDVFGMKDYCKQKQLEYKNKLIALRNENISNENEPAAKRFKIDDGIIEENIAFIRSNFTKDVDLPKSILHAHTKKNLRTVPTYATVQHDKLFRAVLTLHDKKYSSSLLEKNKKNAEQSAALVCLLHMNLIAKQELIDNGCMMQIET